MVNAVQNSVMRIERSIPSFEYDAKAHRMLREVPIFFPEWSKCDSLLEMRVCELFWIKSQPNNIIDNLDEILGSPVFVISQKESFLPQSIHNNSQWWCIEKNFRPGVTDNTAKALEEAIELVSKKTIEARSGLRLWICLSSKVQNQRSSILEYANKVFANDLIEKFYVYSYEEAKSCDQKLFQAPDWPEVKLSASLSNVERFDFRDMTVSELTKLSHERMWALNSDEMQIIQSHFKEIDREATDVEIEVLAQTWSEHCKHKIFAADIEVENQREDVVLPKTIKSLFKTYIKGATAQVEAPYLRSVFEDNAGVISINDEIDCAIKVETHNSPSALDPYGGALTGIVGVNRDILGVGLGAKPVANLDVFCVGPLDWGCESSEVLPLKLHHPNRILEGIRKGVEHGGNKSGVPTVTGAVVHHPRFLGKPLVFCGTIGTLPKSCDANLPKRDLVEKEILPGDLIVMVGGRIGKDGIHGATFSSLELNEDSPVSAVQLGDPLTQKRVWDFLIEARDLNLYRAVTDNGAGGLSSSVGELATLCGKKGGATMDVALAKTKYPGLTPFELTVSESQERMTFAVPECSIEEFLSLAKRRSVECSVLGEFEDSGYFEIQYDGKTCGKLSMKFLHDGLPQMKLKAKVTPVGVHWTPLYDGRKNYFPKTIKSKSNDEKIYNRLIETLSHPNVCSRRDIVEQYDHEVQGGAFRKPYGTRNRLAPNDGATVCLSRKTYEGVALGVGLQPDVAICDPRLSALMALDEAMRNALVAGLDPSHAALVDNFCWPDPLESETNPDAQEKLGALVLACHALHQGAILLGLPFVSGKDSMKNDYRMGKVKISVPPTVLVTVMGKVHDVRKVPTGFIDRPCSLLWISAQKELHRTKEFYKKVHSAIRDQLITSAHDVSDGGWLTATAEMFLGSEYAANLEVSSEYLNTEFLFSEPRASFVVGVEKNKVEKFENLFSDFFCLKISEIEPSVSGQREFKLNNVTWDLCDLEKAYVQGPRYQW